MLGPRLAAEMEGTGLRSKSVAERQDAAVWKGRQVSERLSLPDGDAGTSEPDYAWWRRRDSSLQRWTQDVRVVQEALPMVINRRSAWSQFTAVALTDAECPHSSGNTPRKSSEGS